MNIISLKLYSISAPPYIPEPYNPEAPSIRPVTSQQSVYYPSQLPPAHPIVIQSSYTTPPPPLPHLVNVTSQVPQVHVVPSGGKTNLYYNIQM